MSVTSKLATGFMIMSNEIMVRKSLSMIARLGLTYTVHVANSFPVANINYYIATS